MVEKPVLFESTNLKIEGLFCSMPGDRGVVTTHPHPLYGGNMYNNVVASLVRIYQLAGYTTLRFNFRGVGCLALSHSEREESPRPGRVLVRFLGECSRSLRGGYC